MEVSVKTAARTNPVELLGAGTVVPAHPIHPHSNLNRYLNSPS